MARIFVLLLLISLFATSLALRGQSSNRRLVEEGAKEKEKDSKSKSKKSTKSSKSKKQSKEDKKCKKAKSLKASKGEKTMTTEPAAQEGAEIEEAMNYCLHGELSAEECAALKNGDLPKDDASVTGILEMEIAFADDPKQAKRSLGEILRTETPAKFVGCEKARRVRLLIEDSGNDEEESAESYLSVTGVDFDQVEISKQGMAKAEANIYYEGKDDVSDEERQEMFDLLAETILTQASTGSFDGVGELQSVQASTSPDDGSSSGAGMPIGVAVGGVVVVGALVGLFFYNRRKTVTAADQHKDGSHADTSDDESVVHAHAVLVEDEAKDKKSKEDMHEVDMKKGDADEVEATLVSIPSK